MFRRPFQLHSKHPRVPCARFCGVFSCGTEEEGVEPVDIEQLIFKDDTDTPPPPGGSPDDAPPGFAKSPSRQHSVQAGRWAHRVSSTAAGIAPEQHRLACAAFCKYLARGVTGRLDSLSGVPFTLSVAHQADGTDALVWSEDNSPEDARGGSGAATSAGSTGWHPSLPLEHLRAVETTEASPLTMFLSFDERELAFALQSEEHFVKMVDGFALLAGRNTPGIPFSP